MVFRMPRTKALKKTELLCTRVTPEIKNRIQVAASREGLSSSEWVRNLILGELKATDSLPDLLRVPIIEKTDE